MEIHVRKTKSRVQGLRLQIVILARVYDFKTRFSLGFTTSKGRNQGLGLRPQNHDFRQGLRLQIDQNQCLGFTPQNHHFRIKIVSKTMIFTRFCCQIVARFTPTREWSEETTHVITFITFPGYVLWADRPPAELFCDPNKQARIRRLAAGNLSGGARIGPQ